MIVRDCHARAVGTRAHRSHAPAVGDSLHQHFLLKLGNSLGIATLPRRNPDLDILASAALGLRRYELLVDLVGEIQLDFDLLALRHGELTGGSGCSSSRAVQ